MRPIPITMLCARPTDQRVLKLAVILIACALAALSPGARAAPGEPASPTGASTEPEPPQIPLENAAPASALHRCKGVVFRGNRVIKTKELDAIAASFVGRELNESDVEQLRLLLTRLYTDRGYINSGVILDPKDPYGDDLLHFSVIEGRLTDIQVHGSRGLNRSYVVDRLRDAPDETLNINTLRERFQLLLDDPLFARVNSRILPGSALGEAILDVDVERARPYSLTVALNDYRPPSIGEKEYAVSGQLRDATGFGDTFDASVSGPIDGKGGANTSVAWKTPVNRFGTEVGADMFYGDTVISEEPLAALNLRSIVGRYELTASQPFYISLIHKLRLNLALTHEYDDTSLAGIPFSLFPGAMNGNTRDRSIHFGPDYSYHSERQYLGVRLTGLYAHLLNPPADEAVYAQPDRNYFIWTVQALHLLTFADSRLELQTRALVQRTHARISDLQALPVGGVDSVRGFPENTLLQSNVTQFNVDLRWHAMTATTKSRPALTLGPFVDWADGYDVDAPSTVLASVGGATHLAWPHVRFDLAIGARIRSTTLIDEQHGAWQDHGIHAQVAADL